MRNADNEGTGHGLNFLMEGVVEMAIPLEQLIDRVLGVCPFIGALSASSARYMVIICSTYVYVVLMRDEIRINGQTPRMLAPVNPLGDKNRGGRRSAKSRSAEPPEGLP